MPLYRIADFVFDIETRYDLTHRACRDYRIEAGDADFSIRVSDEALEREHGLAPENSLAYTENIAVCRAVSNAAAKRGAVLLHAATVKVGERAYAFSAPSGTGKSTHIRLWREVYGSEVEILNGDKPFLREREGKLIAYGTPWCGKEGWQTNSQAPLSALCFLERGEKNAIRRLDADEALDRVFRQLLKPEGKEGLVETMRFADLLIRSVPIYLLSCNISHDAARLSFETMTAGE